MKGIQRIALWGMLTTLTLVGCNRQSTESTQQVMTLSEKPQERIEQKRELTPAINYLSSRLNITLNYGGRNLPIKGDIKIVRDKHIQVSIQPFLGIEMVRADITPDSICVIDRIKKRYVLVDMRTYVDQLPINLGLNAMQSLFLNELFLIHKNTFTASDARKLDWKQGQNGLYCGTYNYRNQMKTSFWLNPKSELMKTGIEAKSHKLDWEYSQFKTNGTILFPESQKVTFSSPSRTISAVFDFQRTDLNKPMTLSLDLPRSYTQVSLSEMLNILGSL